MKVNVLVIDFMGKMGSLGKHEDDFNRISNVYIEVGNLVMEKILISYGLLNMLLVKEK